MEYQNHKITEAVCAFRFDPSKNDWDLTRFADYYNKIKNEGFDKKEEIKPFELKLELRPDLLPSTQVHQREINMVYKSQDERYAILLSNNYISFHCINHYPGWEVFTSDLIHKYIEKYFEIGLGNGLISSQMIYINNFELVVDKYLSDYVSFVPKMQSFGDGEELSHFFQSVYDVSPNKRLQIKTIFNALQPEKLKRVTLECNCIANNTPNQDMLWQELAKDAHDSAKNAFIKITSDYFKTLIQ